MKKLALLFFCQILFSTIFGAFSFANPTPADDVFLRWYKYRSYEPALCGEFATFDGNWVRQVETEQCRQTLGYVHRWVRWNGQMLCGEFTVPNSTIGGHELWIQTIPDVNHCR